MYLCDLNNRVYIVSIFAMFCSATDLAELPIVKIDIKINFLVYNINKLRECLAQHRDTFLQIE